jgi:undecaprenyl-diphosphatase
VPSLRTPAVSRRARALLAGAVVGVLVLLVASPASAAMVIGAVDTTLTAAQAVVLGIVEGVTEYLPISSTGHLLVTARILGLPDSGNAGDAMKSYEIAIQSGAIIAVLGLYRHRFATMIEGVTGRSEQGKRMVVALIVAFIPAAILGLLGEKVIKEYLFGVGPTVAAWIVGGVFLLVLVRNGVLDRHGGRRLEGLTNRDALIIGLAQVVAMWPGTSRSMVTIVAALLIGYSMSAAIEFSFLLGVVTLGAATAYSVLKDGKLMLDTFGLLTPLIGFFVALVAAWVTVRWMVTYLQRHSLAIFGWYRIGVAGLVLLLLATHAI